MDSLVWKTTSELLPIFGKQLALLMDAFLEEERSQRLIREEEQTAHDIAVKFLRTLEVPEQSEQLNVVHTMYREYLDTLEKTVFDYAILN